MKHSFFNHFVIRGVIPLITVLLGVSCSSIPSPIETGEIIFPDNSRVFPVDFKWKITAEGKEMFAFDRKNNNILHYRNYILDTAYSVDSILNYPGGDPALLGYALDGNDLYLLPYEPEDILVKHNIVSETNEIYHVKTNADISLFCLYNECPILFTNQNLIVPVQHNSLTYATDDSLLFQKFSQPKSVVLNKKDLSVVGYLGKFNPSLKYNYFDQTYPYQTSMGKGIAMSGFINDTICIYDENFVLTNKLAAPSDYYKPLAPMPKGADDDRTFTHNYQMEGFFYGNLKYSEPLNILIRCCRLSDVPTENGLIKSTQFKAFSLQFFKDGKLLKEVPLGHGQYSYLCFQVLGDKLIAFTNKTYEDKTWEYHIYRISDFL